MISKLTHVSVPVDDYEQALRWYTEKLGTELRTDGTFGPGYRFLTVGFPEQDDLEIVLFKNMPGSPEVNKVSGWILGTNDCHKEVQALKDKGVQVVMEPQDAPWGIQAAFSDLYGNTFMLVEAK
ncbi:MAG: VOC family protein [Acidobacteriota bacterium]